MFKKLTIQGWRQYQNIEIDFHDRLTILTGANGSGKTTILNVLNRHFGWMVNFVSTPRKRTKDGILEFFSGISQSVLSLFEGEKKNENEIQVGKVHYNSGKEGLIKIPQNVKQTYHFNLSNQEQVKGLHIPSHRPTFVHQEVSVMPTNAPTRQKIFTDYSNEIRNRYISGASGRTPNYYLKEALISLAIFGYGNSIVSPNDEARELFEGFQEILKKVLPPKLCFTSLSIEMPEVVLRTASGDFPIDSASGGITAIIDLAWQIYTFSEQEGIRGERFVVTIDEPENHLHPEMQKVLLKNFIDAFPNAQFIVATHNPFIVTSVPESNVYVLKYNAENRVESFLLDQVEKAGSSNEILREVLGLSSTIPLWAEERLQTIVSKYSQQGLNNESLSSFRKEMTEIGFQKFIPETLSSVIDKHDQSR